MTGNLRRVAAALVAVALLVPGCSSPFAETPEANDASQPFKDLAARPSKGAAKTSGRPAQADPDDKGAGKKGGGSEGGSNEPGDDPGQTDKGSPDVPGTSASFETVGLLADDMGDAKPATPGYADALSVEIESDGRRARVIVAMADSLPDEMTGGEIEGVGVDLFRDSGDYQVFASGEPGGWYGYLYTPDGFVKYQGTFGVAGRTIVFTVPWSALGGREPGTFSAFVDWTGPPENGSNDFSQDVAPEEGTADFTP